MLCAVSIRGTNSYFFCIRCPPHTKESIHTFSCCWRSEHHPDPKCSGTLIFSFFLPASSLSFRAGALMRSGWGRNPP